MCRRCICRKCPASIRVAESGRGHRGDRPALPRTRCGHDGGAGRALAGQRGYHINCNDRFEGLLHQQRAAAFHQGHALRLPWRSQNWAAASECANAAGVGTRAHEIGSLELEYGTLVPMRYMNGDDRFKVVSVAAWCAWHTLEDSRRFGAARRAQASEATAVWRCWPAARCRIASTTTAAAAKPPCTRSAGSSSGRWTARGGSVAPGRLEDLFAPCCRNTRTCAWAGRHARYRHAVGPAGLGCLRPAGGDRHRVLRQLRHGLNAVFPVPA